NVEVMTGELEIPSRNGSRWTNRDTLDLGNDLLYGDLAGSLGEYPGAYADVVFGDYGNVTQDVFHAIVGAVTPGQPNGGYTRATFPVERIMSAGRIRDARSVRFEAGGIDTIYGNGGDDFLFGGKPGDTIDGAHRQDRLLRDPRP